MNKRLKAGIYAVTFFLSTAFLPNESIAKEPVKSFTAQMKKSYTTEELLDILKKAGFQAEKIENKNGIIITVDGDSFALGNDYNGDIHFVDFYDNLGISLDKVNTFNGDKLYGKLYIDDDDDDSLVVNHLLPAGAGLSSKQIVEGVKDFLVIKKAVQKDLFN